MADTVTGPLRDRAARDFPGIAACASRILTLEAFRSMPMASWSLLQMATGALSKAASVALAFQAFRNVRPAECAHAAQGMASFS